VDRQRLLDLADQVATGSKIDWDVEEHSSTDERELAVVRSLRNLASISSLFSSNVVALRDVKERAAVDSLHPASERMAAAEEEPTATEAQPPAADDLPDHMEHWGSLERLERVGRGAYGSVYKAWDPKLQIWVALKLGHHDASMLEEARLLARLRHENVVRIYGAEAHDGRSGIWMELVQGRNLAEIVNFEGPMSEAKAIRVGQTLARAVAAVHQKGVIHEDIKAYNVMREEGGRLLLMDFGAGVRKEEALDECVRGHIRGTPCYLAPEILDGEPASVRSDIYSLGVLLFHLVTGEYPVVAEPGESLRDAHRRRRALVDLRPELSARFCGIVERCLDPVPEQRFASAGRVAHALEELIPRRLPALRVVVAVLAALVIGASGYAYWRQSTSYSVEASLYQDADVGKQLLVSGSRVQPGDRLFMEMSASKPLHVYVINRDEEGVTTLLFPIPGLRPANPIAPDEIQHLPGFLEQDQAFWKVTSAGGRESFLVIASLEPVHEIEEATAGLQPARFGAPIQYPQLNPSLVSGLRGIGGLAARPATPRAADDSLFQQIQELTAEKQKHRGVWVRRIELDNPLQ
jgi:predicted Ser/Thr protein kinase